MTGVRPIVNRLWLCNEVSVLCVVKTVILLCNLLVIQEYGKVNCDIYIAYTVCGRVEGPICFDSAKKWFSKFLSIHITIEFQMAYESMQFTVFFCLLQLKLVVSLLQGKNVLVLIKS